MFLLLMALGSSLASDGYVYSDSLVGMGALRESDEGNELQFGVCVKDGGVFAGHRAIRVKYPHKMAMGAPVRISLNKSRAAELYVDRKDQHGDSIPRIAAVRYASGQMDDSALLYPGESCVVHLPPSSYLHLGEDDYLAIYAFQVQPTYVSSGHLEDGTLTEGGRTVAKTDRVLYTEGEVFRDCYKPKGTRENPLPVGGGSFVPDSDKSCP